MAYIDKLKAEREHFAELAYVHARGYLDATSSERAPIMEAMQTYMNSRDKLDQQIAWMQRNTLDVNGKLPCVYPTMPAWQD